MLLSRVWRPSYVGGSRLPAHIRVQRFAMIFPAIRDHASTCCTRLPRNSGTTPHEDTNVGRRFANYWVYSIGLAVALAAVAGVSQPLSQTICTPTSW